MLAAAYPISVLLRCVVLCLVASGSSGEQTASSPHETLYTFRGHVLPVLESRCSPCHFAGGKMYDKLPFDDSATVVTLGVKLNTRLNKKEERAVIEGWIKDATSIDGREQRR